MPTTFALIASAFQFFKRQPALMHVLLWMLALPALVVQILLRLIVFPGHTSNISTLILLIPVFIILILVIVWGLACVLLSVRRTMQTKAGRARTSFRTLRKESSAYVGPLISTYVLGALHVLLRFLLLIVPGILYSIRISFACVAVVCEDVSGLDALNRSVEITKGRTWRVYLTLLFLGVILFVPTRVLSFALEWFIVMRVPEFFILADIVSVLAESFAATLFTLSLVELFGTLRRMAISVKL